MRYGLQSYVNDLVGRPTVLGTFIVNLKDNPGVTEADGPAECTIRMAAQDFVDLTEGKANGQQLFFTGKLKVEGDMSLALRLQALMDILK